jgi:hypothetical protein
MDKHEEALKTTLETGCKRRKKFCRIKQKLKKLKKGVHIKMKIIGANSKKLNKVKTQKIRKKIPRSTHPFLSTTYNAAWGDCVQSTLCTVSCMCNTRRVATTVKRSYKSLNMCNYSVFWIAMSVKVDINVKISAYYVDPCHVSGKLIFVLDPEQLTNEAAPELALIKRLKRRSNITFTFLKGKELL